MKHYYHRNIFVFLVGLMLGATGVFVGVYTSNDVNVVQKHSQMNTVAYNKEIGEETKVGVLQLIAEGRYKCCLENPCSYCFTDTEHQDREMVCDCLVDIIDGKAPCGECLGEILEGEGNELLAEYFAQSVADELGQDALPLLKDYMEETYGIAVSAQL